MKLILTLCLTVLLIAGCSSGSVKSTKSTSKNYGSERSGSSSYTVVKGDTLYAIAWKLGLDYKTLARWNSLRSPYVIYPGNKLKTRAPANHKQTKKPATKVVTKKKPTKKSKPGTVKTSKKTITRTRKTPVATGSGAMKWAWPTNGALLSTYKAGDPVRTGIKIVGSKGQKIYAAESGSVVYVGGGLIGYGQLIIIKHNNKYLSAYGHNSHLLVKEGEVVKKGKHIANMGSANSGRAMLHFEVRKFGKPTDPLVLLPKK